VEFLSMLFTFLPADLVHSFTNFVWMSALWVLFDSFLSECPWSKSFLQENAGKIFRSHMTQHGRVEIDAAGWGTFSCFANTVQVWTKLEEKWSLAALSTVGRTCYMLPPFLASLFQQVLTGLVQTFPSEPSPTFSLLTIISLTFGSSDLVILEH